MAWMSTLDFLKRSYLNSMNKREVSKMQMKHQEFNGLLKKNYRKEKDKIKLCVTRTQRCLRSKLKRAC